MTTFAVVVWAIRGPLAVTLLILVALLYADHRAGERR